MSGWRCDGLWLLVVVVLWTGERARGEEPGRLVVPFSVEEGRAGQGAWGKYLKVEVEIANSIGMELTLIPAGEFEMGSLETKEETAAFAARLGYPESKGEMYRDEHPKHRVVLTKPYYLGTHEVRRGEFQKFVEETGYRTEAEADGKGGLGYDGTAGTIVQRPEFFWRNPGWEQTDEHPVVNVSWKDAVKFCEWMSEREGARYRLPSEAEWEYASRAGTTGRIVTGDDPKDLEGAANVGDRAYRRVPGFERAFGGFAFDDGAGFTAAVGSYRKNPFGICDLHGNVWEWCGDWYDAGYYGNSPLENPTGPTEGEYRVYRGGGWLNDAVGCRTSRRGGPSPVERCNRLGFRVVREVE